MNLLRKLLFPFSIIYGWITAIRNFLYDKKLMKSNKFKTPTIVVGNLSVGGTGKTPQIEYLIRLLQHSFKVAVLSRGYKRKSTGFIIADATSNAEIIGDEPFQFYQKFSKVIVSVDADRSNGIEKLEHLKNPPEVILLDDAFQHRKVAAGFYILLTSYNNLYVNDFMLPTGNLRENRKGAKRAQIIIVTKCPANLSDDAQRKIHKKLKPTMFQRVFFTTIDYDTELKGESSILIDELVGRDVILITGIANPNPLIAHLNSKNIVFKHLKYADHHHFSEKELNEIKQLQTENTIILTTEKDYMRLGTNLKNCYYISIETKFINHQNDFDKTINNYVEQSTRNG
ncbi:MAG: tetraacyldisaccharide 4'-kinase [Lutibacter sp.]|nr:tetraacyldisaccharide 4'-kinase [Lutibacter sp.]MBP9600210.1 tetraacyldisaccharide 4'-kinase [Lutibacter sp.]